MKETSRGVDCISRPGIRAEGFFFRDLTRVENVSENLQLQDQQAADWAWCRGVWTGTRRPSAWSQLPSLSAAESGFTGVKK